MDAGGILELQRAAWPMLALELALWLQPPLISVSQDPGTMVRDLGGEFFLMWSGQPCCPALQPARLHS